MKKDIYSRFNNEADQSLCKVCITYLARLDILSEPVTTTFPHGGR